MNLDWLVTLYTAVTAFFAAIVHGIAGFGMAQVSMGVMPFFRSVASATIITGIVSTVSNFRVWHSCRKEFEFKDLARPLIGLILGLPVGLLIFKNLDEEQAKTTVGIIILIAVAAIIVGKQTNILDRLFEGVTDKYNSFFSILAGFLGGILGGAVSIPGPPLIVYGAFMSSTGNWSGRKTKSIFTAYFGLLQFVRTVIVAFQGQISFAVFIEALIALPAMLFGAYVGIKIFDRFSSAVFNWVLIAVLTANAIILLI